LFEPLSFDDPFTLFLIVVATVMMLGYLLGRPGCGRWEEPRSSSA
jgi:hypothetical protein